mmetsp:Transcript_26933/g.40448  ORF Transcript_26933/g.40448 Transcript_26933/m.40448 type:complete len:517 (-) Transcript_26933:193-1743(-)
MDEEEDAEIERNVTVNNNNNNRMNRICTTRSSPIHLSFVAIMVLPMIMFSSLIQTTSSSLHPKKSSLHSSLLPQPRMKDSNGRKFINTLPPTPSSRASESIIDEKDNHHEDGDDEIDDCLDENVNDSDEEVKVSSPSSSMRISELQKAIQLFQEDIKYFESLPRTDLTTPCISLCHDASTYTKIWTLEDWKDHSKHALSRYTKHLFSWPTSTIMHNIISAVLLSSLWSYGISHFSHKFKSLNLTIKKFTVALTFLQAPILLLLTLRTNRSLDRLLEVRKAWGVLSRSTRSLMGLVCAHVLPKHPAAACVAARYLAIAGWTFKGMLRNEKDDVLIRSIFSTFPGESEWLLKKCESTGVRRPHAVVYRLRNLLSAWTVNSHNKSRGSSEGSTENVDVPPVILLRMEEILSDIESSIGICNRVLISPLPPTYTRHTSRVLVLYLSVLPVALVGMGISTLAVVVTVAIASYILIGIDEIGLEIENPFPLMPLYRLSKSIQKEVERQVMMMEGIPSIYQKE